MDATPQFLDHDLDVNGCASMQATHYAIARKRYRRLLPEYKEQERRREAKRVRTKEDKNPPKSKPRRFGPCGREDCLAFLQPLYGCGFTTCDCDALDRARERAHRGLEDDIGHQAESIEPPAALRWPQQQPLDRMIASRRESVSALSPPPLAAAHFLFASFPAASAFWNLSRYSCLMMPFFIIGASPGRSA